MNAWSTSPGPEPRARRRLEDFEEDDEFDEEEFAEGELEDDGGADDDAYEDYEDGYEIERTHHRPHRDSSGSNRPRRLEIRGSLLSLFRP